MNPKNFFLNKFESYRKYDFYFNEAKLVFNIQNFQVNFLNKNACFIFNYLDKPWSKIELLFKKLGSAKKNFTCLFKNNLNFYFDYKPMICAQPLGNINIIILDRRNHFIQNCDYSRFYMFKL